MASGRNGEGTGICAPGATYASPTHAPLALDGAICGQVLSQPMQVQPLVCAAMTSLAGLGAEASLRAAELTQWDRDSPCC